MCWHLLQIAILSCNPRPNNVHRTENPNRGRDHGLYDTAEDEGEVEDGTEVNLALIQLVATYCDSPCSLSAMVLILLLSVEPTDIRSSLEPYERQKISENK